MRHVLTILFILFLNHPGHAATLTATATGQRFEGKPIRPEQTVTQGSVNLFDTGQATNSDGAGNIYIVGSGSAKVYGTADAINLEVDTASWEPIAPPPLLNLSPWTLVGATYGIQEEWLDFTAAGTFSVEVAVTYRAIQKIVGDGDPSGDGQNSNTFSIGETWQVYDETGQLLQNQTWAPFYAETVTRTGQTTNGLPFEKSTFTLEAGWRLKRSSFVNISARADAKTWTAIFSSSLRFSVNTRVTVTEGLARLSATSSLARYDGAGSDRLNPGTADYRNGFLALRHPEPEGNILYQLQVSTDFIDWRPVLAADRFNTSQDQVYSVVKVDENTPSYYRFAQSPSE